MDNQIKHRVVEEALARCSHLNPRTIKSKAILLVGILTGDIPCHDKTSRILKAFRMLRGPRTITNSEVAWKWLLEEVAELRTAMKEFKTADGNSLANAKLLLYEAFDVLNAVRITMKCHYYSYLLEASPASGRPAGFSTLMEGDDLALLVIKQKASAAAGIASSAFFTGAPEPLAGTYVKDSDLQNLNPSHMYIDVLSEWYYTQIIRRRDIGALIDVINDFNNIIIILQNSKNN